MIKTTKKAQAVAIFNKAVGKKTRQEVLAQLRVRLNMTDACAKTYFQKIACGEWA